MISNYNAEDGKPYFIKNLSQIYSKCLHIHGIHVAVIGPEYAEAFYEEVPRRIKKGEIKCLEDIEEGGLAKMGEAILAVQKGKNFGKQVVKVANA